MVREEKLLGTVQPGKLHAVRTSGSQKFVVRMDGQVVHGFVTSEEWLMPLQGQHNRFVIRKWVEGGGQVAVGAPAGGGELQAPRLHHSEL